LPGEYQPYLIIFKDLLKENKNLIMFKPIVAVFVAFSLVYIIVGGLAITAPSNTFTVTPDTVYFNWTNGTINISANVNNITLVVSNSTYITQAYGQIMACGGFYVQNQTGDYTSYTTVLNATNWTLMFLTPNYLCKPGRYSSNYSVSNSANSSDTINNLTAVIDIPITSNNTFFDSNKTATFAGSFTKNQSYHAYWFFTNLSQNLTGITIKLTGLSADLDLFLVNSSDYNGNIANVIGRSINRSTGQEEISYVKLPDIGQLWAIVIYGNVTSSYSGLLYFSSLNISNASDGSPLQSINFGSIDPNNSKIENINISNIDDDVVWNVNLNKEIWHIDNWLNNANSANFSLLVPNFTQKLKVKIEWNGTGQWNLTVKDPVGNLIGNSSDRKANVNVSGMPVEEYVEYTGPFSSKEGFWNITVNNLTASPANYNVTAYLWFNATEWLATNFTSFNFNSSGLDNSSVVVGINLTTPSRRLLNGSYGGFIELSNSSQTWKVRLPLAFSVRAGTLIINGNISNSTVRKSWNIGYNATFPFNITLNNTGGYDVYYSYTTTGFLNHTSSNKFMTFTVDSPSTPGSIAAGSSDYINLTVTINTSQTENTKGIYRGWILFNTSNASANSSSYPYELFNLTVEVNLTDGLIVNVVSISPDWVTNISQNQNITFGIQVNLSNGTVISNDNLMGISNFTGIWISESNATAYGYNLTNITQHGTPLCQSNVCYINATTPTGMVGGRYTVYASVKWWNGVVNLTGTGSDGPLIVNATGLYLSGPTSLGTIDEGSSTTLNVSVRNWGPLATSGNLNISSCSAVTIAIAAVNTNCSGSSGTTFTSLSVDPNGTETCYFAWTLIGNNVSGDQNCSFTVTASDVAFNSPLTVTLTVKDLQAAAGQQQQQQQQQQSYQPALSIVSYTSSLSAPLGGTNSSTVVVKNTGTLSATVKLNVSIDSGITATVSPESCSIAVGANCSFTVSFSVSNTSNLGSRSGTHTAYVSTNSSIRDSKSFTFTVLSTKEKEAELNASYQNYLEIFANLSAQLKDIESSGFVSGINLTKAKVLLNDTNATIAAIAAAIAAGNWSEVERLLAELNISIDRLGNEIADLQTEREIGESSFWSSLWIWVAVAVIIIGLVAFIVYMLLPPKAGWHPKKGYKPATEKPHKKIKKLFKLGKK
jgi:hypothetical protein